MTRRCPKHRFVIFIPIFVLVNFITNSKIMKKKFIIFSCYSRITISL